MGISWDIVGFIANMICASCFFIPYGTRVDGQRSLAICGSTKSGAVPVISGYNIYIYNII